MNSLAAICSHAIGSSEWWTLSCVGDGPLERDRDAEFTAPTPPWSAMRERFKQWLADVDALLTPMTTEQFQAISRHPAGDQYGAVLQRPEGGLDVCQAGHDL